MKIKLVWSVLALCGLLLLIPSQALAHLPGQPPFTYVNGKAALYYPVGFASLPDLALPQDAAPDMYLVNTDIDLKLEPTAMPYFPEELPLYTFTWDLGDGSTGTGLELRHTYTTPGSKVITINSHDTRTTDAPQLLSTLFLDIVPSANYTLPQPVLVVNGIRTKNSLTDQVDAAFTKRVMLDASKSVAGTAKIASYMWDLGNRQIAKDAKVTASYDNLFSSVLPVVRVTDKNGVYVDASLQINNTTLPGPDGKIPSVPDSTEPKTSRTWSIVIGIVVLALVGGLVALRARLRRFLARIRSRRH